ncbi:hypothetical protein IEQ34_005879 [Dendrobium chrysotoxum]|uniref:Uncharacterized protein n=1 Tax=Dendrobium chrysotoxum TaxID=161865 RepID=A0AAV7HA41_DENCH|nr:hypothetical protein IEQ34_005879 [Dendrobium chrysotoxum]
MRGGSTGAIEFSSLRYRASQKLKSVIEICRRGDRGTLFEERKQKRNRWQSLSWLNNSRAQSVEKGPDFGEEDAKLTLKSR